MTFAEPPIAAFVLLVAVAEACAAPPAINPAATSDELESCHVSPLAAISKAPAIVTTIPAASARSDFSPMPAVTVSVFVVVALVATTPMRPPTEPPASAFAAGLPSDGRSRSAMIERLPAVIAPPTVALTVGVALTTATEAPTARAPAVTPCAFASPSGCADASTVTAPPPALTVEAST